LKITASNNVLT